MIRVEAAPRPFPLAALLALAMTGFIAIMTETLPAGLLPQISQGFGGLASTGRPIGDTLCLRFFPLAAITLIALTRSWGRRKVLLSAIVEKLLIQYSDSHFPLVWFNLAGPLYGRAAAGLAGANRRLCSADGAATPTGARYGGAMTGTNSTLALEVAAQNMVGHGTQLAQYIAIMSGVNLVLIIWVIIKFLISRGRYPQQHSLTGAQSILHQIVVNSLGHCIVDASSQCLLYTIAPFIVPAGLEIRSIVLLVFGISAS